VAARKVGLPRPKAAADLQLPKCRRDLVNTGRTARDRTCWALDERMNARSGKWWKAQQWRVQSNCLERRNGKGNEL